MPRLGRRAPRLAAALVMATSISGGTLVVPAFRASSQSAPVTVWASAPSPQLPGAIASGQSSDPSISADGSTVGFSSTSGNLVVPVGRDRREAFAYDTRRPAGSPVEQVSLASDRVAAPTGASSQPSVSADGNLVAFASEARLDPLDEDNGTSDIYVHDRRTGRTELVSGTVLPGPSGVVVTSPAISANGRYVAMVATAVSQSFQPPSQVYVYDRVEQSPRLVSHFSNTVAGTANSFGPAISADGGTVAFASDANLDQEGPGGPGGPGTSVPVAATAAATPAGRVVLASARTASAAQTATPTTRVYVWQRVDDTVRPVSVGLAGLRPNGGCGPPAISGDGVVVAYGCVASNLVLVDLNRTGDVFVTDRRAGTTVVASVSTGGIAGSGNSCGLSPDLRCDARIALSGDGRFVAFSSLAPNLLDGPAGRDTNGQPDVFVRDLATRRTSRASVAADDAQVADGASGSPSISSDGRYVAFTSTSRVLAGGRCPAGSGPCPSNVFVRDMSRTCACPPPTVPPVPPEVPVLAVTPGVAPQGRVTTATGSGFPASAKVDVTFDDRLLRPVTLTSTPTGTVRVALVVAHGARLGRTRVTVTAANRSAVAFFLVVPPSGLVELRPGPPPSVFITPRR